MRAIVVEVFTDPARERWESMVEHQAMHPERLLLCTSFDASRIEEPDFAETTIAQLRTDLARGAVMVKVWKNVGLVYKDSQGNFIQIDDPRFQPVWDFLTEEGIPVLAHIGEPKAAWLPLDEKNPHYDYYANHPQYHAYNDPTMPRWETIIEARDAWLARNPDLTVIGAHLGSMAYDVDEVAKRLDAYPHFYVETAERFGDMAIQPTEKVRAFFLKYQDRILYGTDLGTRGPESDLSAQELEEERDDYIDRRFQVHWDYLTRSDSVEFVRTGTPFRVTTKGLGLLRDVVEKFYYRNAERIIRLPNYEQRMEP
jgi:predicted TIM-barrel fold metal-dependent hydrolase